jgi:hypothetical protein
MMHHLIKHKMTPQPKHTIKEATNNTIPIVRTGSTANKRGPPKCDSKSKLSRK